MGRKGSISFCHGLSPQRKKAIPAFAMVCLPRLAFVMVVVVVVIDFRSPVFFFFYLSVFFFFFTILFFYQLQVLIVGPSGDKSAERLFRESLLHKQSVLGQLVVRLDDSSLSNSFLAERRPSLEAMTSRHGKLVSGAYLCRNRSCSSTPITSVQDLRDILDQNHQPHTTA